MALKDAIKEQLYIQAILSELSPILGAKIDCSTLYTDSASAIELAKNPVFHNRTKHVDIQYHFVRENIQKGNSKLIHIPTEGQLADGLTKPISLEKHLRLIDNIGLRNQVLLKGVCSAFRL